MRVLLGAFGTRGDVQPVLALGKALQARGHTVALAVPPESRALAAGLGLEASAAGLSYEDVSRRAAAGRLRDVLPIAALVRGEVRAQLEVVAPMARDCDVIVGSTVFTLGALLADLLEKPYVFVALCPMMLDSSEHPSPAVRWLGLPRWLNRLSWWVNARVWNLLLLPTMNQVRRELGLPSTPSVWRSMMGQSPLLASDPALAPAPADHPTPVRQVGALFVADQGELSAGTRAFLEAGPPPVYVGFGSMADPEPARTTLRLLESVRRAQVRAIISKGWAGLGAEQVPEQVHFAGPEPHAHLFPRCAAVVHHGGAGTTHAAARAGVPQLVLPQILDQFYWRHQTLRLGVSPGPVPRYGDDPEPLATALRAMVGDRSLSDRARALAGRLRGDGTDRAVEILEAAAREPPAGQPPWR